MIRPINPYVAHPVYANQIWEEAKACPIYSGTFSLPPTQIRLAPNLSGDYSAQIINPDSGFVQDVAASRINRACTDSETFFYYKGRDLTTQLDEGMYQMVWDIEGTKYWGHPICARRVFDSTRPVLTRSCGTAPSGSYDTYDYQFDLSVSSPISGVQYSIEYQVGGTWIYLGSTSGSITDQQVGAVSSVDFRVSSFVGNDSTYRIYRLEFTPADACNTDTLTLLGSGGSNIGRFQRLEWENSTDLQGLGLYYGDLYKQWFYFEAEAGFPVPIEEYTFIENGQGEQLFESLSIAEQVNFDIYPVPDALLPVLSSIRAHDTVSITSTADDNVSATPKNLTIAPRQIDGSVCSVVQVSYEANQSYVPGCNEDYTTQSCS